MKALLIYPKFPDTYWSFKHALSFQGKRAAQPPLGLMTIAALLPAPWQKRLVDCNVERLKDADLAWADVALVSGMHVQQEHLISVIERCRAQGLQTVVGGRARDGSFGLASGRVGKRSPHLLEISDGGSLAVSPVLRRSDDHGSDGLSLPDHD